MRGSRNGIEPDVGEENDARGAQNSENAAVVVRDALRRRVTRRSWNHRRVVRRIDELPTDPNKKQHNAYFEDDN